jgi:hypothetical protein
LTQGFICVLGGRVFSPFSPFMASFPSPSFSRCSCCGKVAPGSVHVLCGRRISPKWPLTLFAPSRQSGARETFRPLKRALTGRRPSPHSRCLLVDCFSVCGGGSLSPRPASRPPSVNACVHRARSVCTCSCVRVASHPTAAVLGGRALLRCQGPVGGSHTDTPTVHTRSRREGRGHGKVHGNRALSGLRSALLTSLTADSCALLAAAAANALASCMNAASAGIVKPCEAQMCGARRQGWRGRWEQKTGRVGG